MYANTNTQTYANTHTQVCMYANNHANTIARTYACHHSQGGDPPINRTPSTSA